METHGKHIQYQFWSWHIVQDSSLQKSSLFSQCSYMVQRTDEIKFKDSSTVKRPERVLGTVKSLLASHCVVRQQHKDFVFALDRGTESILKFHTDCVHARTHFTDMPHSHTHLHFSSYWTCPHTRIQRCFFTRGRTDPFDSCVIERCNLPLPLCLYLLPSIRKVMFSLPLTLPFLHSARFSLMQLYDSLLAFPPSCRHGVNEHIDSCLLSLVFQFSQKGE